MTEYILSIILLAPFIGVVVLFFIPNEKPLAVRTTAAIAGLIPTLLSFYLLYAYDSAAGGYQFTEQYVWSKDLGISFFLGVDGISIPLVLASSILLFTGVFISWHIEDRPKEFFIFLLILAAATIGVYVSLDLFFLYFFYEMSVLPMYVLLGIWGSHTKGYLEMADRQKRDSVGFIFNFASNSKEYAAMKLTLFLSAGAVVALIAILIIYATSGLNTFNIVELQAHGQVPKHLHDILFLLIFFGFASIAPIWPLHSWSPVGHAAAPAAVSMLHAGVLMKLGHFSIIRVGYTLFPEATRDWMPLAAVLCVFSIVYGGLVAYFQRDTKYVIGYSSSSHMGYVFLGMAALNVMSMTGAVLYMFAHALATGMLFAIAGYVYDQTHTRDIPSLGGLSSRMPFISGIFIVAVAASFGLPLTVNFIGELMILVGSWEIYPVQTIIAVLGIGLTLAYLFRMMRGIFYGPMNPHYAHARDASPFVDRLPLLVMAATSIYFGLFPTQFIHVIQAGVAPLIAAIQGSGPFTPIGGPF
ncbi:MAG: NADH-quinone oxidoreductase subunit M [Nitrospirae bacterium]|nr:NADH-quinone oxidoreductase subunit M [Nitrospirota bacterium]